MDTKSARAICDATTATPWRISATGGGVFSDQLEKPSWVCKATRWSDATFIASARTLLPIALDRIELLERLLGEAIKLGRRQTLVDPVTEREDRHRLDAIGQEAGL